MPILRDLDAIDWKNLEHAYGSAADVPALLRALASGANFDEVTRALWGNVFHQGSRYQAASYAVPFLFEILRESESNPRLVKFLLGYLHHLALGYPGDVFPRWSVEECACDEWEQRTFSIVERGLDDVLPFVGSGNDAITEAACALLASFPERAAESSERLLEIVERTDGPARGHATLALALLGRDVTPLVPRLLASDERIVRIYTACAAVLAKDPCMCDGVVEELVAPLGDVGEKESAFANDVASLVGAGLAALPTPHASAAISALARAHEGASPLSKVQLTAHMLSLASREPLPTSAPLLTSDQRTALRAVCDHGAWSLSDNDTFVNYLQVVAAFGLPRSRDALRAWLDA